MSLRQDREERVTTRGDQVVRVGVVGVGRMGQNHARVYEMMKNSVLAGVFDPDRTAGQAIAAEYGCRAFDSLESMRVEVDAVSICSPSSTHCEVAEFFLSAGVHCLVEKPLATTMEECNKVIAAAEKSGAKLLVGHIERFNPAVQQVASMISGDNRVLAIDTRRLSSFSRRIKDIDVVGDLMVHDLDIINALVNDDLQRVQASGVCESGGTRDDHVTALLEFAGGAIAVCTASRITENTVRKLAVTTTSGFVTVDYMNQSVEIYHQDRVIRRADASSFGEYALDVSMERLQVRRAEPLQLELLHFIDIISNDGDPLISGKQGLKAMQLVWDIQSLVQIQ